MKPHRAAEHKAFAHVVRLRAQQRVHDDYEKDCNNNSYIRLVLEKTKERIAPNKFRLYAIGRADAITVMMMMMTITTPTT